MATNKIHPIKPLSCDGEADLESSDLQENLATNKGCALSFILHSTLTLLFKSRVQPAGNMIKSNFLHMLLRSQEASGILYSIIPIHAILRNELMRIIFLAFSVLFLYLGVKNISDLAQIGVTQFQHLRLQSPNIQSLRKEDRIQIQYGLLLNGCRIRQKDLPTFSWNYSTFIQSSFATPVRSNGWYLDLPLITELEYFYLEGSNDLINWQSVGSSSPQFQYTAFILPKWIFRKDQPFRSRDCEARICAEISRNIRCCIELSVSRKYISFDHRLTWPMLLPILFNFGMGLVHVILVVCAASPRYLGYLHFGLVCSFHFGGFILFVFAVLWCVLPDNTGEINYHQSACVWLLSAAATAAGLLLAILDEFFLPEILLLFGLAVGGAHGTDIAIASGAEYLPVDAALASLHGLYFMLLGLSAKITTQNHFFMTLGRFRPHWKAANDAVAAALSHGPESEALAECDRLIAARRLPSAPPRHTSRLVLNARGRQLLFSPAFWTTIRNLPSLDTITAESPSESFLEERMGLGGPVACLDQLQAQAAVLQPFLQFKAEAWARASDGLFPSDAEPHQYVPAAGAARPEGRGVVRWRHEKAPGRIVEKFVFTAGRDASRVADVCRQRIVFDRATDLRRCLAAVLLDGDVQVEAAHNSMRVESACRPTYHRCVVLALRIVTVDTARLGVDGHVAEVQLMLRALADMQDRESHSLYVHYRNAHDCRAGRALRLFAILQAVSQRIQWIFCPRTTIVQKEQAPLASWIDDTPPVLNSVSAALLEPEPEVIAPEALPSVTGGIEDWLLTSCVLATVLPGDALTSQLSVVYSAMARASYSSCFFTATPFAAAFCKRIFQLTYFNTGSMYMAFAAWAIYGYGAAGEMTFPKYRFTAYGNDTWAGLNSLGLLLDGCTIVTVGSSDLVQDLARRTASFTLNSTVSANGWFFEMPSRVGPTPLRFGFEGSKDPSGLGGWTAVGTSRTAFGEGGRVVLLDGDFDGIITQGDGGGDRIDMDMRAPLLWLLSWMGPYLTAGLHYWWVCRKFHCPVAFYRPVSNHFPFHLWKQLNLQRHVCY